MFDHKKATKVLWKLRREEYFSNQIPKNINILKAVEGTGLPFFTWIIEKKRMILRHKGIFRLKFSRNSLSCI